MKKIIFLIFLLVELSYAGDKALNVKKVPVYGKVNQNIHIDLTPPYLTLHEIGHKILYSVEFAFLHITSNSPYTVYFSTKNNSGNIYKNFNYLQTYYLILPYNAPLPSLYDRRWMDGMRFNSYYETPSDYLDYKRKIYVKAIKNSMPYGSKEYEEEIEIRVIDINGNIHITGFKIFYK